MDAADVYSWLMQGGGAPACSSFDSHVLASVLALVAAPGCYVTTATLALAPLVRGGLEFHYVETGSAVAGHAHDLARRVAELRADGRRNAGAEHAEFQDAVK